MARLDDSSGGGGAQLTPQQIKLQNTYPPNFDPQFRDYLIQAGIGFQVLLSAPASIVDSLQASAANPMAAGAIQPFQALNDISGAWADDPMQSTYGATQAGQAYQKAAAAATTATAGAKSGKPTNAQPPNNTTVPQPAAAGGVSAGAPGYIAPKVTQGQLAAKLKMDGYSFPFDTRKFMNDALKNSNGDAQLAENIFMGEMIKSPQFKAYYPGIFDKSGRMIVSISDYDNQVHTYQELAAKQGFKVTRNQAGVLISGEVSPSEFSQRVDTATQLKTNHPLFDAFNDVLKAKGLAPIKNAQDAFNFLNGKANPAQYQAWNAATAEMAAKQQGLDVSAKEALSATGQITSQATLSDIEKSYGNIADQLRTAGVELSSFGLSQRDLETIQFGGANRGLLAARAQTALNQRQAQVGSVASFGEQMGEQVSLTKTGAPIAGQQKQAGA